MEIGDYLISFRTNIRHLRDIIGLSQREAAKRCSFSYRKYQRLESGETSPGLEEIIKLAKVFNVSVNNLIDFKTELPDFRFLTEAEILAFTNGSKFLDYIQKDFLPKYRKGENFEFDVSLMERDSLFMDHELPLAAANFQINLFNAKASKLRGVPIGKKNMTGDNFVSRKEALGLMNYAQRFDECFIHFTLSMKTADGKVRDNSLITFFSKAKEYNCIVSYLYDFQ
ncbi:MAG: helix-turn-helix domain-containing protein [Bacteriovoracaceae bacterium]